MSAVVVGGTVRLASSRREAISERARAVLEQIPRVYLPLARHRSALRTPLDSTCDLVIEGYPRSANTFLMLWIARANPELRIASHLHSIANVHEGLRLGLPVVVVIRPPEDAIASLALYSHGTPLDQLVERYRRFHRGLIPVADDIVISPFAVSTGDPAKVVEAIAAKIGRPLTVAPPGGHHEIMSQVVARNVEANGELNELRVGRPSETRNRARIAVIELLHRHFADEVTEGRHLYEQLATGPSVVEADLLRQRPTP